MSKKISKKQPDEFLNYFLDLLRTIEAAWRSKYMFGGYAIFKNDLPIAIVSNSEVYLKGDNFSEKIFLEHNCEQFSYPKKDGRIVKLFYWKLPQEAFDDTELLEYWIDVSYKSAIRKTAQK